MSKRGIGRRRFVLIGGGALGGSALACAGMTALATHQPGRQTQ